MHAKTSLGSKRHFVFSTRDRKKSQLPKGCGTAGQWDTQVAAVWSDTKDAWSADYPHSLPFQWKTLKAGRPSLFLRIICERWQFGTDTDWEILILKVCKFNSKCIDIFVRCIKIFWDFRRGYPITNNVMLQHGSAADLVKSTVNLSSAIELGMFNCFKQFSDT